MTPQKYSSGAILIRGHNIILKKIMYEYDTSAYLHNHNNMVVMKGHNICLMEKCPGTDKSIVLLPGTN